MFPASSTVTVTGHQSQSIQRKHISIRFFGILFGIELCIVLGVLFMVLQSGFLTTPTPTENTQIQEAAWSRVYGDTTDPLLTVAPGMEVRASHIHGFDVNGTTYFYYLEGTPRFDPLSRPDIHADDVVVMLYEQRDTDTLVVYKLNTAGVASLP
ncbi:MAG: hypothetical protein GFH27_549349n44 [Chloroflexi bacterium AL-W]|nr:hypothetical protein [Chloroflexi bacterium AL-N1]NOK69942.1 hypothetical protein [Chloroflexi bacterium AL-N10]NOK73762.1 hypothetical protein [Chloroflexi bacterium AL-N5]NOK85474.1 hypothetical protein [Chloroflexi bacterium AL-W]NOK91675.1 hypothetical protein [Chloroflexi bacterium AL-N15]